VNHLKIYRILIVTTLLTATMLCVSAIMFINPHIMIGLLTQVFGPSPDVEQATNNIRSLGIFGAGTFGLGFVINCKMLDRARGLKNVN
jgi:hypothetical protein